MPGRGCNCWGGPMPGGVVEEEGRGCLVAGTYRSMQAVWAAMLLSKSWLYEAGCVPAGCAVLPCCAVPRARCQAGRGRGWSSPAYRASAAPGDQDHFFTRGVCSAQVISPANLCPPAGHATGRMACAVPVWHVPAAPCGLCRPLASVTCLIRLQAVSACFPFLVMPHQPAGPNNMPAPQGCVPFPTCPQLPFGFWLGAMSHACACWGGGAERGVFHC